MHKNCNINKKYVKCGTAEKTVQSRKDKYGAIFLEIINSQIVNVILGAQINETDYLVVVVNHFEQLCLCVSCSCCIYVACSKTVLCVTPDLHTKE